MKLSAPDAAIEYDISTPNVTEIIFCAIIAALAILLAVALILVFRRRPAAVGIGPGNKTTGLPGGDKELAVKKNASPAKRRKDDSK